MDRLDEIGAFVAVADARSFTQASRKLGVSGAQVSKLVARLEKLVSWTHEQIAELDVAETINKDVKEGMERQQREWDAMRGNARVFIPPDVDYRSIPGLSNEMVERLLTTRPPTLGAAGRIRGITPAALAAILVHARRKVA